MSTILYLRNYQKLSQYDKQNIVSICVIVYTYHIVGYLGIDQKKREKLRH